MAPDKSSKDMLIRFTQIASNLDSEKEYTNKEKVRKFISNLLKAK